MAAHALPLGLLCLLFAAADASLTLDFYDNSALHGTPSSTTSIEGLAHAFPLDRPYSAEISGTMTVGDNDGMYAFACSFGSPSSVFAFVWIDDHLVCHTEPPFGNTPSSTDGSGENPLRKLGRDGPVTVVVHIYSSASTNASDLGAGASTWPFAVRWQRLLEPSTSDALNPVAIPAAVFDDELPALELKRRELQDGEKRGWNTWSYNLLSAIKLPASCGITTAVCQLSTQQCLTTTHIQTSGDVAVRVGLFAADRSVWQFYLGFKTLNVSVAVTGGADDPLRVVVDPVNCRPGEGEGAATIAAGANCSDYALVVSGRFSWGRVGQVQILTHADGLTFEPLGLDPVTVAATVPGDTSLPLPKAVAGEPHIALPLGAGAVALAEVAAGAAQPILSDIQAAVDAAWQREKAHSARYGGLSEVKTAVQSATMWNYVYVPSEYGPFLPVSRSWNFVKKSANEDWDYVIFDWDNFFASLLAGSDSRAKNMSYSNLIQVVKSRTSKGFVPNYSAGGSKSVDRTEPPIGAFVLRELHAKYQDDWIVELLFADLLAWNDWFLEERTLGPLGLVSLGSDTYPGYADYSPGSQQGARFESGLDNSPMYDGDFFNASIRAEGSGSVGQMELYDVGMASMFTAEARALADLARGVLKNESLASLLDARADAQAKLISGHLWEDGDGIYTNRFWNGTFYKRRSPTSFYALLAEAASRDQAESMVQHWLLNPKHFCVAPDGDFAGNDDTCYWGLPSIEASDPAFPPLGYWRGYVWGPMAQLTYWSLRRPAYADVPVVQKGRKALAKQMTALMLSQWHAHRHICENFNPHKTADTSGGDCSGSKFYHWGALTGLITLMEEGLYNKEPTTTTAPW